MLEIIECLEANYIKMTFSVMQQLRPHLIEDQYIKQIHLLQQTQGYRLVGIFKLNQCVAVTGFRLQRLLVRNAELNIYVDDFVSDQQQRSQGYGKQLLDWVKREAARLECCSVILDSGLQRKDAHRFYLREGFNITASHFEYKIEN